MITERIELTLPRAQPNNHPALQWQLVKDERGFYAREWFDVNKLTDEERARYESEVEDIPAWIEEIDRTWAERQRTDAPRFPTLALAHKWACLCDEEERTVAAIIAETDHPKARIIFHIINVRKRQLLIQSDRPEHVE